MVCFVLTPICFAYRHAATTFYQLQRGFGGQEATWWIQEFLSVFFLVVSLFYSLKRGSNGFISEITILILYKGSRGGPLFSGGGGGGVSNFFSRGGGPNANFYRNTYMYLLFSRGSVRNPLSPSGSTHGQCHHNGPMFITVRPLTFLSGLDLSGLMTG